MSDFEVNEVGTQEQLASHQKNQENDVFIKKPSLGALIKRVADLEKRLVMCGCAVTLSLKALKSARFTDSTARSDVEEAAHMLVQCLDGLFQEPTEEEMKAAS